MAVILNRNFRMFCLDVCYDLPQGMRTADTGHILYTDFIRSEFDQFHRHLGVIFDRMDGRVGDAQRALRDHPCCFRISDGRSNVAYIVQSAEYCGRYLSPVLLPGRTTGERRQVLGLIRRPFSARSSMWFVCRPHGTASSIRVRLCLGFHPNNKFTCSNPPPLVSTRAKQPISIMAGATRVSWSTVETYFPADCHMSRRPN